LGKQAISLALAEATFKLTNKVVQERNQKMVDMVAKAAFITLNQMVNLASLS